MYEVDFSKPIHIHFIGIGGISMSGLAEILLKESFPDRRIAVDTVFLKDMEQILYEKIWYRNETYDVLQKLFVQIGKNAIDLQILYFSE